MNSIYLVFSIKPKDSYRPKYTSSFFNLSKSKQLTTSKRRSCNTAQKMKENFIFCVMQIIFYGCKSVIDKTSMNVFYSMEDNIFSKSLSLLWDLFNRHIVVFFETSVLKEVRILRFLYNNSAVLRPKFQNKAMIYHSYTW